MNSLYDDSFTPWETPSHDEKFNNYLKLPGQIHFKNICDKINDSQFKRYNRSESKNYFIQRNIAQSQNKSRYGHSRSQLKKLNQSQLLSRNLPQQQNLPTDNQSKLEQLSTLINFSNRKKLLNQRFDKTKIFLERQQRFRIQQNATKSKGKIQLQESLRKFLSLSKTSSHLNLSTHSSLSKAFNSSASIDYSRSLANTLTLSNKKTCNQQRTKLEIEQDDKKQPQNFLESKTNSIYLKKRANNKTFHKPDRYGRSMNLPKIEILDKKKIEN